MNQTKVFKKVTSVLMVLVMAVTLLAVAAPLSTQAANPKISKKKLTLEEGKSKKLKISNAAKDSKVTWSTNKKAIATVTKAGKVKAVKAGKATITAKYVTGKTTKTFKCKVTVEEAVVEEEPIEEEPVVEEPTTEAPVVDETPVESGDADMPEGAIFWEDFEGASHDCVPYDGSVLTVKEGGAKFGSKYLISTEREKTHFGPSVYLGKLVNEGSTYTLSAWVRNESSDNVEKVKISVKHIEGGVTGYKTVTPEVELKKGEWNLVTGTFEVPAGTDMEELRMYIEMPSNGTADFSVDGISIVPVK